MQREGVLVPGAETDQKRRTRSSHQRPAEVMFNIRSQQERRERLPGIEVWWSSAEGWVGTTQVVHSDHLVSAGRTLATPDLRDPGAPEDAYDEPDQSSSCRLDPASPRLLQAIQEH